MVSTDVDADTHLSAYVESDFLGASDVSNSRESNSYQPRLRQFFSEVDQNAWGFHFLAGQAWSLLTTNTEGIMARSEQVPMTIDSQYVPGFNWSRNPQARFVEDFGNGLWAGISIESPQSIIGGNNPNGTAFANNQTNPNANNGGDGTGLLSSNQTFTTDTYPDVIAKVAFDTGFGHFEAKGVERIFTDRYNGTSHDTVGGGCRRCGHHPRHSELSRLPGQRPGRLWHRPLRVGPDQRCELQHLRWPRRNAGSRSTGRLYRPSLGRQPSLSLCRFRKRRQHRRPERGRFRCRQRQQYGLPDRAADLRHLRCSDPPAGAADRRLLAGHLQGQLRPG
ncbi:MAG: hypothetical protein WDN69_35495 [Aliidongia sp.]